MDETAGAFYSALAQGDGESACSRLAPETRSELEQSSGQSCSKAILDEGIKDAGDRRETKVFGTMAQVRFAGDTAFLTEFDNGWRIMAASCNPTSVPQRYDCSVTGG